MNKSTYKLLRVLPFAAVLVVPSHVVLAESAGQVAQSIHLKSMHVTLPVSNGVFKPGPGSQSANEYCMICHSAGFMYNQPPLTRATWKMEVNKMRNAMGCPVPEKDVETIAQYMYHQNGAPAAKAQRP